jgi:hypothetical protein
VRAGPPFSREAELLKANWSDWAGELPELLRSLELDRHMVYQRMINPVEQDGSEPNLPEELRIIDPLRNTNPWRFERGLMNLHIRYDELMTPGILDWLETDQAQYVMEIYSDTQDTIGLQKLTVHPAVSPFLCLRQRLTIDHSRVKLTALKSSNFRYVRRLEIRVDTRVPAIFKQLQAGDFRHIHQLVLGGNALTEEFANCLFSGPWDSLARLTFDRTSLPSAFWVNLFQPERMSNLTELIAFRNPLGDTGAKALAQTVAKNLLSIELMNCQIGDEGIIALLEGGLFERLVGPQFNFSMNRIGDTGAKAIAENPGTQRFTELVLRENRIGDIGAFALAFSPHLANVTYLDLWKNRIGDLGAEAFVKSPDLQQIQALNLRDNPIGPTMKLALSDRFGDRVKI